MTDVWTQHARTSGRRAVISPNISEADFDRVTAQQIAYVEPLLRRMLEGEPWAATLDYGCGPGRFLPMLEHLGGGRVVGYEPCQEYIRMAPAAPLTIITPNWHLARRFVYDMVFIWLVFGGLEGDLRAMAEDIAGVLRSGGLLVFADHVANAQPPGRWWRFRRAATYVHMWASAGIDIAEIGRCDQAGNEVTIFAGRRR